VESRSRSAWRPWTVSLSETSSGWRLTENRELIDPLRRMRRSLARYSAPVSFVQVPSWADFITTMVGFRIFGTHRLNMTAKTVAFGKISRRNSSSLGVKSVFKLAVPVV
jgi:hypothetical protein